MLAKKSIRYTWLLFFFGFCWLNKAKAQSNKYSFTGVITDSINNNRIKLTDASITINTLSINTSTDNSGRFYFEINALAIKSLIIDVKGYNPKKIDFDTLDAGNIDLGEVRLSLKSKHLKEVIIKATKRYADTVKIDLSNEKFERFYMVDDLMGERNGFSKNANGQLFYKGKLITNVLVNGSEFFGKDNLNIYKHLPALTINDIQIIETNIDSVTNATVTVPRLKIDLKLKDQYKKMYFGSTNQGLGTSSRYIINAEGYNYKNERQIALAVNSNNLNINDNSLLDRNVSFTTNGNNVITHYITFNYRNLFKKKIEFKFDFKGLAQTKSFLSEISRKEEFLNLKSSNNNSSKTKALGVEQAKIIFNYNLNSLTAISFIQSFKYNKAKLNDSLRYSVVSDTAQTTSAVNKARKLETYIYSSDLKYQKHFHNQKGKALNIGFSYSSDFNNVGESNNVFGLNSQTSNAYFFNVDRGTNNAKITASATFDSPVLYDGNLQFMALISGDRLKYNSEINTETTQLYNDFPVIINNHFYQTGAKLYKTFGKLTIDALLYGIINNRTINEINNVKTVNFIYPIISLKTIFKLNKKNDLSFNLESKPIFPDVNQLTGINTTFDLLNQFKGNNNIKPEYKNNLDVSYNIKSSDSSTVYLNGSIERYYSKFGDNVTLNNNSTLQTTFTSNIGNSLDGAVSATWNKTFKKGGGYTFVTKLGYQEIPVIVDLNTFLNKSYIINNSVSTTFSILAKHLTISPDLSLAYNRYIYQTTKSNILLVNYSDKISIRISKIEWDLYPLATYNYNKNITSSFTWAVNSAAKMPVLNKRVMIWLRAYDIFNSFKFYNNYAGANYIQSVKYSNTNRYIIAGFSIQLNNIK